MKRPIVLKSKNCALVPIDKEDVDLFYSWLNDLEVSRGLNVASELPLTHTQEEKWYEEKIEKKDPNVVMFAIQDLGSKKIIGNVSIEGDELGVVIGDKEYWGKGLGPEAIILILDYGFNKLDKESIFLRVTDFNERAKKAYLKIGFKDVGTLRRNIFHAGKWHDMHIMDIIKDDFNKNNESQIK